MEFLAITLIVLGGVFGLLAGKKDVPKTKINASLDAASYFAGKYDFKKEEQPLEEIFKLPVLEKTKEEFPVKIREIAEPDIAAKSAIVLDMDTNKILAQKNAHIKLPIASISKIITALAAFQESDPEKIIEISKEAVNAEGSAGNLEAGEKFKMKNLIDLMLISSSNDAAAQIALEISGNIAEFGKIMNEKARYLGLKKSSFEEPSGLSEKNVSTAFEIASLADETFFSAPEIWEVLKNKEIDVFSEEGKKRHLKNTNDIISSSYVISGKTGFSSAAKGSLVIIADSGQNNKNIIVAVLGSDDRFGDAKKLAEWARNSFKWDK